MTAFLLTWAGEDLDEIEELVYQVREFGSAETLWRLYAKHQAFPGDHVFILKQGDGARGIFGFGRLLDKPADRLDPRRPDKPAASRARVRLAVLGHPIRQPLLIPARELQHVLSNQINAPSSGQSRLPDEAERWLLNRLEISVTTKGTAGDLEQKARAGPTRGPVPVAWTGMMSRDPSKAAHTYSFRFGRRNLWKIGHAQDLDNRLAEVNKHVPEEAVGEKWERYLIQKWPDSETAYEMEQTVLVILTARRTVGERVICNQRELEEAWTKAAATVSSRRRRVPLG